MLGTSGLTLVEAITWASRGPCPHSDCFQRTGSRNRNRCECQSYLENVSSSDLLVWEWHGGTFPFCFIKGAEDGERRLAECMRMLHHREDERFPFCLPILWVQRHVDIFPNYAIHQRQWTRSLPPCDEAWEMRAKRISQIGGISIQNVRFRLFVRAAFFQNNNSFESTKSFPVLAINQRRHNVFSGIWRWVISGENKWIRKSKTTPWAIFGSINKGEATQANTLFWGAKSGNNGLVGENEKKIPRANRFLHKRKWEVNKKSNKRM